MWPISRLTFIIRFDLHKSQVQGRAASVHSLEKLRKINYLRNSPQASREHCRGAWRGRHRWPSYLALGGDAVGFAVQLVQGAEVGFGRGHNDVRVSAHAVDHAATVL